MEVVPPTMPMPMPPPPRMEEEEECAAEGACGSNMSRGSGVAGYDSGVGGDIFLVVRK